METFESGIVRDIFRDTYRALYKFNRKFFRVGALSSFLFAKRVASRCGRRRTRVNEDNDRSDRCPRAEMDGALIAREGVIERD